MIAIGLLFAMCLFSACVSSSPPANKTPLNVSPTVNMGIESVALTPVPDYVGFDEAKGYFLQSELLSLNQFQKGTRVLFIQGGNLDESGNAERWVFGVNKGDTNELRVYDHAGWTIIPWNNAISAEEINLDSVVSPAALFKQYRNQTVGSSTIPAQRDIELSNGTYKLTITSGSTSQVLMFNASTGAAIGTGAAIEQNEE